MTNYLEKYTDEWWSRQHDGLLHTINSHAGILADQDKRLTAAHRRIDELEAENEKLREAVGELANKHAALVARLKAKFEAMEHHNGKVEATT